MHLSLTATGSHKLHLHSLALTPDMVCDEPRLYRRGCLSLSFFFVQILLQHLPLSFLARTKQKQRLNSGVAAASRLWPARFGHQ
ncbi:hypothetical protein Y032_0164g3545 [Ancylostoma ceylanicum]|uniref:Uncharacterized protein n=1 Tax=Ancylostoma ceylanicum TaxID=53326 RepID=A0A016SXJ0_9BILA|nr:hypothetical protein Y032_0164g3545 [Ancylostoma ceylanicum]